MNKLLLGVLVALAFVSSHAEETVAKTDTTAKSRIRVFGQNGAGARVYPGLSCVKSVWSSDGILVSGGMGQAFSSFVGMASNISLGMAETDSSRNLSSKDGILSKAYYQEHEIAAGQPASVALSYNDVSSFYIANGVSYSTVGRRCGGNVTFTPQAGMDYEAGFAWSGKKCSIVINQILSKDGNVELHPVPVAEAPSC
ncbi:hypothetical protein [Iodobacter fluviatilis]|uniref:Uncharacterized protein n=1 Tax=Iodobacter fluviatilis TaxID=537 RepID=A0A377SU62_9NEIS|nr:hypothetical protein [Iodobacter fluviatilis]TCU88061.1 hypothetical protein EV682_104231 [Iodobacter fluviatilis]STR45562.1 Uncharacterised protein [Iodobacter fluviatilis]